jgi:hypothetical protein
MITYSNYNLQPGLEYVKDGFTIRKTVHCSRKQTVEFMRALCAHLIAHPDPMVVPIYDFQYLGQVAQHDFKYSYDMLRLGEISEIENRIIWQVGYAHSDGSSDPVHNFKHTVWVKTHIDAEYAWKNHFKLMTFLEKVISLDRYHDLHGENVMMDNDGEFRLIDIDGFNNPPLSLPENNWITGETECQPKVVSNWQ